MEAIRTRQIGCALASFLMGVWAFAKISAVSGPKFEPIIAACSDPGIPFEEFASTTGYHVYEPMVGLKVFEVLVCLITQFLLELRETFPAGILVWGGVIVVSLPVTFLGLTEAGRPCARGPIRYPTLVALLYQLFGISVVFPLVWVPSFVFGEGTRGSPVTPLRVYVTGVLAVPGCVTTAIVFLAPTDSTLWTTSAGVLGGPILVMLNLVLSTERSSELPATKETIGASFDASMRVLNFLMGLAFVFWYVLVGIAHQAYGTSFGDLWNDVWVEADASVAFMTIDTLVLYAGVLMYIAYRGGSKKAAKALLLTLVLGPGTACLFLFAEIERETTKLFAVSSQTKKLS